MKTRPLVVLLIPLFISSSISCQQVSDDKTTNRGIYSKSQLEELMKKPPCLEGYRPNQSGPLSRVDAKEGEKDDSTFTVEKVKISSDGLMINGWLYLPLGSGKFPLIVLTNGGGDGSRQIKSLSDWIAPILAHSGFAAFVHDKRGTGESDGSFVSSTYEDFIRDAGNCAIWLSKHQRIDPDRIGIMGGSEGGIIAVAAACRYPEIKFVISQAGTVVSGVEDRLNAQLNGMLDRQVLNDSLLTLVKPLWTRSFLAWASHDPEELRKVDTLISEWRKNYDSRLLPFMKSEMETMPEFSVALPTWNSMGFDYLTELSKFKKPWIAIFGEVDHVVPTQASVKNIQHYMELSDNKDYSIAIIPKCGHAPVNVETKRLIRIDHLILNWLDQNIHPLKCIEPCTVTYIANEGYLIGTAHHKILIDALFGNIQGNWCDQPSDSIANLMLKGLPPFDNIDMVLVTHKHVDHFNESMVTKFMMNNRKSILVCPDQVNDLLKENAGYPKISHRIHSLKSDQMLDTILIINGINLGVMRFNHGSWFETDSVTGKIVDLHSGVENFGYLIETDGFTLFHSGDDSPANKDLYNQYGFNKKEMDIAFMDRVFLRRDGQDLLNDYIHTNNLIFMHIEPNKAEYYQSVIKSVPEMFVFTRPMEKRTFVSRN
jgi:pimeloyl-ACP methyl ester carboxylesterase/L-ascorbate metabolism protein UlaG (beta-lactamase superfamily)